MQAALERDVGRELQTTPGEAQMPACPANGIRSMLMLAPGCSPLWLQSELTTSPDAITNSGGMPTFGEQVSAVRCGQAGASALLVIGADVGDLRAGLVSLVLRGWLV